MKIIVFLGPSLPRSEAASIIDAEFRSPVAQGDVYEATLIRPDAIAIIDGYFGFQPAVWHKEILWAMTQGIHVFGAASMGAWRAVELGPFGMVGHGWIYEAYRDGRLEGEDEVAITHGPAAVGYKPISEALVNMRRTFASAADAGVMTVDTARQLVQIAKRQFFPKRDYEAVITAAQLPAAQAADLSHWIRRHAIDQKRRDASSLLHWFSQNINYLSAPKRVAYQFSATVFWAQAVELKRREMLSRYPGRKLDHARIEQFTRQTMGNADVQCRQQRLEQCKP
ncbi:tfuA protein (plasmid) [Skermanella sp. TT6]|uniref:TfuA protein n=1 Tax=Skermanella cutis TaxID=2775420 RepID=A0ABX7BFM8_9PROT|nr:TfuA-like protein [Skermanella sp. TT6]QQP93205.1 tfuA protein [Skermanella sp. TT6]